MRRNFTFLLFFAALFFTASAQRVFNHPGSILSQADLDRIRMHVEAGDEPWASCWKELQADNLSKSTYTAQPSTEIGGSNGTRQRAAQDAYAAMLNAIEWHVTGKVAYADCAAEILTAWANKLVTVQDELYQYPCRAFIVAAELLRTQEGFYEGWAETDRAMFLEKVRTLMVPACRKFCTYQGTHPSWYTPCALSVLAGGVLLDDEEMYQEGYDLMMATNHWGTMYGGSIEPSGQMREMGRDNVHGGLTLGDITQACLVAWNQGDDMFGEGEDRLLRGMEYWCRYNTGHTDTFYEPLDCSGLDNATGFSFYYISTHNNAFRLRPDACSFEAVYHHYKEIKQMDEAENYPCLGIAAKLARPDTNNQMLGYGTLFFTIDAANSPYMTEKPAKPEDVKAEAGIGCAYISWKHPVLEDARGFNIYRSTDGRTFSLLKTWDYYTNNEYKDEDVETGKNYYYKVQLLNKAGSGPQSDVVSVTIPEPTDELPLGWTFSPIGTTLGKATFSSAQETSFTVSGAGKDIGGMTDSEGFLYKKITGDATLTVRLVSTIEQFYKVGIQMRGSLSGNAQRVGITLGETGCRMLRTCIRSSYGGNTSWVNGTNYGRAPLWLRISREDAKFTTYLSRDSITWHQLTSVVVSMPKTYYVGMASCSGSTTTTYQAIFDHVSLEGSVALPTIVPSAPTNFSAVWSDTDEAALAWNSVANADSFYVYRDDVHIATTRATNYIDTKATAGTYMYKVSGWNAIGEGKACAAKQVTTDKVVKISGSIIGTSGSYSNNSSRTGKAALNDNLTTFYDAANVSGDWVGYDLGTRYTAQVVYVKYAPRSGYSGRMTGGKFQVANEADFSDAVTVSTVSEAPTEGSLTKVFSSFPPGVNEDGIPNPRYRYLRYIGPDNGSCNVAEVQFFGRKVDETAVGIIPIDNGQLSAGNRDSAVYDLSGSQIAEGKCRKGLYIVDGKKVIIK
ncbi:MAG: alginate lyase family protein [Bacteroidaceae bacterium]